MPELASLGACAARAHVHVPSGFGVGDDTLCLKQAIQNVAIGLWVSGALVEISLQKRGNVGKAALRLKQGIQKSETNNFQHLVRECIHKWSRSNIYQHVQLNSK